MKIEIQLLSFLFSILYGIVYFIMYRLSYTFLYNKGKYSIINSFLFNILSAIIYYKIMLTINNGNIKIYFVLISILTFLLLNKLFTKKL